MPSYISPATPTAPATLTRGKLMKALLYTSNTVFLCFANIIHYLVYSCIPHANTWKLTSNASQIRSWMLSSYTKSLLGIFPLLSEGFQVLCSLWWILFSADWRHPWSRRAYQFDHSLRQ
jgi:hypothetical protein